MKNKWLFIILCGLVPLSLIGAEELIETQSALVRESAKFRLAQGRREVFKQAVGDLPTDAQEAFWKIYADYERDKKDLDETHLRLLDQYVSNSSILTDDQLTQVVMAAMANQDKEQKLRKNYFNKIRTGVSGKAAARFYQTDDLLTAGIKLATMSKLPYFQSSGMNSRTESHPSGESNTAVKESYHDKSK